MVALWVVHVLVGFFWISLLTCLCRVGCGWQWHYNARRRVMEAQVGSNMAAGLGFEFGQRGWVVYFLFLGCRALMLGSVESLTCQWEGAQCTSCARVGRGGLLSVHPLAQMGCVWCCLLFVTHVGCSCCCWWWVALGSVVAWLKWDGSHTFFPQTMG